MDSRSIPKFLHQTKKSVGRLVPRKHRLVNQGQCSGAEIKEFANLEGAVLKPNNLSGPLWSGPEQRTMVKRKVNEKICPCIYPSVFGSSVEKGTYLATAQEFQKKKDTAGRQKKF